MVVCEVHIGSRGWLETMTTASKHISLPRPSWKGTRMIGSNNMRFAVWPMNGGDELMAKKLPTLLEGEALAVWLELTTEQQGTYQTAKSKIVERMALGLGIFQYMVNIGKLGPCNNDIADIFTGQ